MYEINETHDPALTSWVQSANDSETDFPIQNLPFAIFRPAGSRENWRVGVAIGDQVLDLNEAAASDAFVEAPDAAMVEEALEACSGSSLNAFMAQGVNHWTALRLALSRGLRTGAAEREKLERCLLPQSGVEYTLPATIGDYTDFYSSIHHATNVGRQFRPDNPLLPNYRWIPIAYHGRSSSIGVSGQRFHRPVGQIRPPEAEQPSVEASRRLDFELEVGIFIGPGNDSGAPLGMDAAEAHVFGLCLLNDWSARDLQAWEYQPLGPFLSKNFATTISPWVVTLEALAPYRCACTRPAGDPRPLAYLDSARNREAGAFDLQLEAAIQTEKMRAAGEAPYRLCRTNFRHSYWSVAQMVAHHTINGCNLRPGDLFGSGTQSGPDRSESGSLLELSSGGKAPVELPDGERRGFIDDGDTIILRGYCEKPGAVRIGFGASAGTVLPAKKGEKTG